MERVTYRLVATGIIKKGNKVLISLKGSEPRPIRNQWYFPGGNVEAGENPFYSVLREIKEETGLRVKVLRVIDFFPEFRDFNPWKFKGWMMHIVFECEYTSGKPFAKDDIVQVKWASKKEILEYTRKNSHTRLAKFLKNSKNLKSFFQRI
ncbi:MAG: NUDIX domain-containing protein [Candidatus Aenigmarchaeota archaeon]|nr:NUDIX domain-containing protein [Candidatus Aenigmarchaeota archaeon]